VRAPAPAFLADLNDETIEALTALRDTPGLEYQQLMEIAGVDYPDREERFEVVYCLLSLTRNHRLHVHVTTDDEQPVPTVTGLWPVAGWLEREIFDLYGVLFSGNQDLRRILTDYGFRKDFPLTGYLEMRYSEEAKRVVYEPVKLAQDFRTFDFMSPWEGAEYVLPGDEKAKGAALPEAKGAPSPVTATQVQKADAAQSETKAPTAPSEPYTKKDAPDTSVTGKGENRPDDDPSRTNFKREVIPGPGGQNQ
jgi:NADH-quinone oxidoreductase subunit C